jgi:hypothetical protein
MNWHCGVFWSRIWSGPVYKCFTTYARRALVGCNGSTGPVHGSVPLAPSSWPRQRGLQWLASAERRQYSPRSREVKAGISCFSGAGRCGFDDNFDPRQPWTSDRLSRGDAYLACYHKFYTINICGVIIQVTLNLSPKTKF